MATKKPGKEVAVVKSNAPAVVNASLPDYLQGYAGVTGAEGIESNDVTIPRLKLGQAMSSEVKDGTVEEGDLFSNLTKEIFAKAGEALNVVTLYQFKEYILWRPREDNGGGILARATRVETENGPRYKWDLPNTSFEVKVGGKVKVTWKTKTFIDEDCLDERGSEIPGDKESGTAATLHHNFVVGLLDFNNQVIAISLSKSAERKGRDYKALLKLGARAPIWAKVIKLTSVDDKNKKGDQYKNYDVQLNGFVTAEDFKGFTQLAESFAKKTINFDQSDDEATVKDGRI